MSEEEKSFTVKDRRAFKEDGSVREDSQAEEPKKAQARDAGQEPPPRREPEREAGPSGPLPPPEFNGLILSLAHAAMLHLGQVPDPSTGQTQMNLELARHTIDTIGMLKDKTAGNLTAEEKGLIDHALTDLRLAFVKISQAGAGN